MAIGVGLGFKSIARFCSGLWDYLTARVQGRTAVELERERNHGTTEMIKALPPGAELLENEPNGRSRMIRTPHPSEPLPPITHLPVIHLPVIHPPIIHPQANDQTQPKGELTE